MKLEEKLGTYQCISEGCHVKWVACRHEMARSQITVGADGDSIEGAVGGHRTCDGMFHMASDVGGFFGTESDDIT
jgi:hypothetical protein